MTELAAPPKRRTGLLIWLIVSQLLAVGSLLIWALIAGLSVMAFDEGSSPEAWAIVNNKLYLTYNHDIRNAWLQDKSNYIAKADRNWHLRIDN